ncbi:MAG TPA: YceI family protein [Phototrophicaceae bacterium]|jgi:polyisoprenoid-binding protein YceI|nr:YceI family protein [Phototrophicaceae bacterium]
MNLRNTVIVALVSLAVGAGIGVFSYIWLVGGSGTPSAEISAPTLDINALPTLNPTQAFAAVTQVAELSTQVAELSITGTAQAAVAVATEIAPTDEIVVTDEAVATTELVATEEPAATEETATDSAAGERTLYRIDSTGSTVTFHLQEDLQGVRTDVIGTTNEVAGDIIVDASNPAASQLGTIRINARTLATDNEFRNRALRSRILQSADDAYEFIEFVPTTLSGLPAAVTVGESYQVEITGDLTIAGQTHTATFTTTLTLTSADQLTGNATTVVQYADWGIRIPSAPGVANVTEDVTLTIDFVANKVAA